MGKVAKATKKFQKTGLKRTIDQRRKVQKHNQKITQGKNHKKSKPNDDSTAQKKDNGEVFEDMSVEEFMNGGSELMEPSQTKENKRHKQKKEKEQHKVDLDKLAENDPEFYKYLKSNDPGLLDFNPESDQEEEEDDDEEEEEAVDENDADEEEDEDVSMAQDADEDADQTEVTMKDVKAWKKHLQEHSLTTLKKVLKAFTAAVQYSEDNDVSKFKYSVTSPDVFNALLVSTLSLAPEVVKHHAPLNKEHMPTSNKKLKTLTPALRSYATSLTTLLKGSHDASTCQLILKSAHETLPYFLTFRKVVKNLVNTVADIFASTTEDETRLAAFSFLKSAAATYPKSLLELILKATYGGIVKTSRKTNIHTMPAINMQKNLSATLYEIDSNISYQNGFQFIRQLAVHLRSSIVNKTAESYKQVYNWQFMHSLDFWSRVLCAQCDQSKESLRGKASPLRELIHPLVQVTLGAARLIPTPQYFPLRFYLTRSLIRLSQQTGVYIPLVPILTEILTSTTITKSPKPSTAPPLDFEHNIRAGTSYLNTRVYQDGVCDQFIELMSEFYALHCKSVAFPELCIPVVISLKRFTKRSKNVKFNKQLQQLVDRLEQNSKFIETEREKADFGPTNKEKVNSFLKDQDWAETPLGKYVIVHRQVREERARILRESLEDDKVKEKQDEMDLDDLSDGPEEEDDEDEEEDSE